MSQLGWCRIGAISFRNFRYNNSLIAAFFYLLQGQHVLTTLYIYKLDNCPSRMMGKSEVVFKKALFIEKCNKAAYQN
jgi:hypothetical protein